MRTLAGGLSLAAALLGVVSGAVTAGGLPRLADASLGELRAGLNGGRFSSEDLVRAYLERIDELNGELRAVIETNPDAVALARERDAEAAPGSRGRRGPLHDITVLVKDNLATRDGMNTTARSFALLGARPSEESTVVTKLRRAGAIVLGKTNISQWASARSPEMASWSARGGFTMGAYMENQDPSSSSSGSAVAASIGIAWTAIGTDTIGSVLMPASAANCVGLRPTPELVSRDMVIPLSHRMDSVGPIARSVKDSAYLLAAITGHDNDTASLPDYVAACRAGGLRGKRIGFVRNLLDATMIPGSKLDIELVTELSHLVMVNSSLPVLRAAGAEVVDIRLPAFDIRDFTVSHDSLENYPQVNKNLWDYMLDTQAIPAYGSKKYQEACDELAYNWGEQGATAAFEKHSFDAIVLPPSLAGIFGAVLGLPAP